MHYCIQFGQDSDLSAMSSWSTGRPRIADRGYVLESGKIVQGNSAEALADDPALEAAYPGKTEAVH